MDRKKSILALTLFLFLIGFIQAKEPSFDEICHIYNEAKNSSLVEQQLADYINTNVASRVSDRDAITSHSIIPQVAPKERYKFFKESAEVSLKRKWDCPAMKALMK